MRRHLQVLCEHYGIELGDRLSDLRGHRLPMRRPGNGAARAAARSSSATPPVPLDPVSGDGIHEALVTRAARRRAHARAPRRRDRETLEPYECAVRRGARSTSPRPAGRAKVALDRYPRAVFAVMRLPVTLGRAREAPAR